MSDKDSGNIVVSPSGGMLRDLVMRLKLILRLMGDKRVNFLLKLLPVATLAYLISPIDLISAIPGLSALDDNAIVSLGNYLFVELCPPNVVQEHMKSLANNLEVAPSDEIVEAETTELPDEKQ